VFHHEGIEIEIICQILGSSMEMESVEIFIIFVNIRFTISI
jgi:hypothetical protein